MAAGADERRRPMPTCGAERPARLRALRAGCRGQDAVNPSIGGSGRGVHAAHGLPDEARSPKPARARAEAEIVLRFHRQTPKNADREHSVIRMPSYDAVADDPILYAHASRILHHEANPGNARALVQRHGDVDVWLNPPPIPLTTKEMDAIYELPYQRVPHPFYGDAKIPAYEMIRFSIAIQRGCFGGCTFCSITEHEGRIIQNRSEDSVIREIETIRDTVPGFTGVISDLGGPTANMYRIACKSREIESACRTPVVRVPGHLPEPEHRPLAADQALPPRARAAGRQESADRFGRALRPRDRVARVREGTGAAPRRRLPQDRARGDLADGPLSKMMKPGVGTLRPLQGTLRQVLEGSRQGAVPDPVLHRGASRHARRGHARARALAEAQRLPRRPGAGLPAVADGDCDRDVPLGQESAAQGDAHVGRGASCPKGTRQRRLHKAFLRYHDPNNWPLLREALRQMGRADLIGNGRNQLIPTYQPIGTGQAHEGKRKPGKPGAACSAITARSRRCKPSPRSHFAPSTRACHACRPRRRERPTGPKRKPPR